MTRLRTAAGIRHGESRAAGARRGLRHIAGQALIRVVRAVLRRHNPCLGPGGAICQDLTRSDTTSLRVLHGIQRLLIATPAPVTAPTRMDHQEQVVDGCEWANHPLLTKSKCRSKNTPAQEAEISKCVLSMPIHLEWGLGCFSPVIL